jgi:hypothetical protein
MLSPVCCTQGLRGRYHVSVTRHSAPFAVRTPSVVQRGYWWTCDALVQIIVIEAKLVTLSN